MNIYNKKMQFARILLIICYLASFIVTRRHLRKRGGEKKELNHHCVYQFFGTQCNSGMECDERRGSRCKRKEDEPCTQQSDCITNTWCDKTFKCKAVVF